jgi:Uma2 family endonuclease
MDQFFGEKAMSTLLTGPHRRQRVIEYPDSDGEPMAETGIHVLQIIYLYLALRWWFRAEPQTNVGANMFLYYREGRPKKRIAPDVYVAWGVPKRERRSYKIWEEKQPPQVVFEVTSPKTREVDLGRKRLIYAEIGVAEYYLFDPFGQYLKPPFRAYRLDSGEYVPREIEPFALFPDKPTDGFHGWRLSSNKLNLELRAMPTNKPDIPYILRFFDRNTGEMIIDPEKAMEEREKFADIARAAEARAAAEAEAREILEKENALLRAELEKLRGKAGLNSSGQ